MALRVIPPSDTPATAEPVTMTEALIALASMVAAEKPTLVMIVWEATPGKIEMRSLPDSIYVREILAVRAAEMLHPDLDGEG